MATQKQQQLADKKKKTQKQQQLAHSNKCGRKLQNRTRKNEDKLKRDEPKRNETSTTPTNNLQGPQPWKGETVGGNEQNGRDLNSSVYECSPHSTIKSGMRAPTSIHGLPPPHSKSKKNLGYNSYLLMVGGRPISLHCSGSKEHVTCPFTAKSSPSIPQPLCASFPGLIFTDFTLMYST